MGDVKVKREMLCGTDSVPVYLVLGSVDGMALGIRPVVLPQMKAMFVGWRVRLCNHENIDSPLDIEDTLKNSALNAFEWGKINSVRASAVFGTQLPMPVGVPADMVITQMGKAGLVKGLVDELAKNFTIDHPVEDVMEFTNAVFAVEIGKLIKMIEEATGKVAASMPMNDSDSVH